MDTSKEYILMCEKAEEIQKFYPNDKISNFFSGNKLEIWLPRQDQLQEMIVKAYGNCRWHKVFSSFLNWYGDVNIVQIESMEQLWLAFVMKEKYQKTWSGKDWIKEKNNEN